MSNFLGQFYVDKPSKEELDAAREEWQKLDERKREEQKLKDQEKRDQQ